MHFIWFKKKRKKMYWAWNLPPALVPECERLLGLNHSLFAPLQVLLVTRPKTGQVLKIGWHLFIAIIWHLESKKVVAALFSWPNYYDILHVRTTMVSWQFYLVQFRAQAQWQFIDDLCERISQAMTNLSLQMLADNFLTRMLKLVHIQIKLIEIDCYS
jgi:hypothetical protein